NALKEEVSVLWTMCQPVLETGATAEETIRLVDHVYIRMEELLVPRTRMIKGDQDKQESEDLGVGPTASEEMLDQYRPVTNWVYRGAMNPEFIRWDQEQGQQAGEQQEELERMANHGSGSKERSDTGQSARRGEQKPTSGDVLGGGQSLPSLVEELLALEVEQQPMSESTTSGERAVCYPEWDHTIQDYRMNWCRVVDRPAEASSDEFVSATLTTHESAIKSLRRFFESLRRPAFRRIAGQAELGLKVAIAFTSGARRKSVM
ncbi:MAG: hypothetical protein HY038_10440, partial [Nitrospirae bacterium]|nr:hypothetical protein [Nitrospirota bacterium]